MLMVYSITNAVSKQLVARSKKNSTGNCKFTDNVAAKRVDSCRTNIRPLEASTMKQVKLITTTRGQTRISKI
jgi:hypothetical protein